MTRKRNAPEAAATAEEPQKKKETHAEMQARVRKEFGDPDKAKVVKTRVNRGVAAPKASPAPKKKPAAAATSSKAKKKKVEVPSPSTTDSSVQPPPKKRQKITGAARMEAREKAREFIAKRAAPASQTKTTPAKSSTPKKAAATAKAPVPAPVAAPTVQVPLQQHQMPMNGMPMNAMPMNGGLGYMSAQEMDLMRVMMIQQNNSHGFHFSPQAHAMTMGFNGTSPLPAAAGGMTATSNAPSAPAAASPAPKKKTSTRKPRAAAKKTAPKPQQLEEEEDDGIGNAPPPPVVAGPTVVLPNSNVVPDSEDDVTADDANVTNEGQIGEEEEFEEEKEPVASKVNGTTVGIAVAGIAVVLAAAAVAMNGSDKSQGSQATQAKEAGKCFADASGNATACDILNQAVFDCPTFGVCVGGELVSCESPYYELSSENCVLNMNGNNFISLLRKELTTQSQPLITCDVSDRPLFFWHALVENIPEGMPKFGDFERSMLTAEGFSPVRDESGQVAVSLPVKEAQKLVPMSCIIADRAHRTLSGVGDAIVSAGVATLAVGWSLANAYPLFTFIGFLVVAGVSWILKRKALKKQRDREVDAGFAKVLERLRNSPKESMEALHLRDDLASEMYHVSQAEKIRFFKEKIFPRIAKAVIRDTRVVKTTAYNCKGAKRDQWQWAAKQSVGKTARFA